MFSKFHVFVEMDGEDQGTVVMLTLAVLLSVCASLWFGCNWYRKRVQKHRIQQQNVEAKKTKVKQTFSRFSQVDEELVN